MNFQNQGIPFFCNPYDFQVNYSRSMGTNAQNTPSASEVSNGTQSADNQRMARRPSRGGVTPFPVKLHILLESNEYEDIISWQPNGRSFVVHKPQEFVDTVMPIYFNQTKLKSFQRQLNLYEFERIPFGPEKGAYYHAKFMRGESELCKRIIRVPVKSQISMSASSGVSKNAPSIPAIPPFNPQQTAMNLNSLPSQLAVASATMDDLFRQSVEQSQAAALRANTGRASFVHHSAGVLAAAQLHPFHNMKGAMTPSSIGMIHPLQSVPLQDISTHERNNDMLFQQSVMNSNNNQPNLGRASFVHHTAGVLSAPDQLSSMNPQRNSRTTRKTSFNLNTLQIPEDSAQDEDIYDDLKKIDELFGKVEAQYKQKAEHQQSILKRSFERASFVHHAAGVLAGSEMHKSMPTNDTPSQFNSLHTLGETSLNHGINNGNNVEASGQSVDVENRYQSALRANFQRASFVHHSAGVLAGSEMQKPFVSNSLSQASTHPSSLDLQEIPLQDDDDEVDKKIDELYDKTMKKRSNFARASFVHPSAGVLAASDIRKPSNAPQIRRLSSEELKDGDIDDDFKRIDEMYGHLAAVSQLSTLPQKVRQRALSADNLKVSLSPSRIPEASIPEDCEFDDIPLDYNSFSLDPNMIDDIEFLFDQKELENFSYA